MKYLVAIGTSLWFSAQSLAIPITWEFGGTINSVVANHADFPSDIAVGDSFSGLFTFETETVALEPGDFRNAILAWQVNLDGTDFGLLPPVAGDILISNDWPSVPPQDSYSATINARRPVEPESYLWISGIGVTSNSLDFLADGGIPAEPPDLSQADFFNGFFLQLRGPRPTGSLRPVYGTASGSLEYLRTRVVSVPEPSTLSLMLLPALALVVIGGRADIRSAPTAELLRERSGFIAVQRSGNC
jgi:hypothetical protein